MHSKERQTSRLNEHLPEHCLHYGENKDALQAVVKSTFQLSCCHRIGIHLQLFRFTLNLQEQVYLICREKDFE